MAIEKLSARALTSALKKIAAEVMSIEDDGSPITRHDALARLMWNKALGWTEILVDDHGTQKKVSHPPESWAMQYIFERLEGKAAPMVQEREAGVSAADKVRELSKDRLNKIAVAVAGPPKFKHG